MSSLPVAYRLNTNQSRGLTEGENALYENVKIYFQKIRKTDLIKSISFEFKNVKKSVQSVEWTGIE